jgi:hypothetical protein
VVPPDAFVGPTAALPASASADIKSSPVRLKFIRFYFRQLCATLGGKQER